MKVLVLGANGQIGRLVVEEGVAAGFKVMAVARREGSLADSQANEVYYGQLTDKAFMREVIAKVDIILSAVGIKMVRQRKDQTTPTAEGLATILEVLKEFPEKRLVLIGTPTLVDKVHDQKNLTTIFPNVMAKTFMPAAHRELKIMQSLLEESGANWTVVRFINPNVKSDGKGISYVLGDKRGKLSISRRNIARFMVTEAIKPEFKHKMPIVFNK